jgi:anti-sigma B factor antagonist
LYDVLGTAQLNKGAVMEVSEEVIGSTCVVVVSGRPDGATSAAFAERVGALTAGENPRLLLDFGGIEFVTSAGLRAVSQVVKRIKASGGLRAMCNVQDPVREVLDIRGCASMFSIHRERPAAIAAMAG